MTEEDFSRLIDRSEAFQNAVGRTIDQLSPVPEVRFLLAFQSGLLAFEHSVAALQLIGSGLFASGYSLFRPQFESLVRGIWLLHTAPDAWVEKLGQPLTEENAKKANEGPMVAAMLEDLGKSDAPTQLVMQLQEYKAVTWTALNSYTHGGIHPLSRTLSGYPAKLTYDALRNSNAVTALTAQLMAILSGDQRNMAPVRSLHEEFVDCIPIIKT